MPASQRNACIQISPDVRALLFQRNNIENYILQCCFFKFYKNEIDFFGTHYPSGKSTLDIQCQEKVYFVGRSINIPVFLVICHWKMM